MHAPNFAVAVAATAFFRMSLDALLPLGPDALRERLPELLAAAGSATEETAPLLLTLAGRAFEGDGGLAVLRAEASLPFIKGSLAHADSNVRCFALAQLRRCADSKADVVALRSRGLLALAAAALSDEVLAVASKVTELFVAIASSADGAALGEALADAGALGALHDAASGGSSVVALRALSLVAGMVAAGDDEQFGLISTKGLLAPMLRLWRGDDPLVKLNAAELFGVVARRAAGFGWLRDAGVLDELCRALDKPVGADALDDLARPAILDCLTTIVATAPPAASAALVRDSRLVARLWVLLKAREPEQHCAALGALRAVCAVASGTVSVLQRCADGGGADGPARLGPHLRAHDERSRVAALGVLTQLAATLAAAALDGDERADLSSALRHLVASISNAPTRTAYDELAAMGSSLSDGLRLAAYAALAALAAHDWAAEALCRSEGAIELLTTSHPNVLTPSTDELRLKHAAATALLHWEGADAALGAATAKRLRDFAESGPFATQAQRVAIPAEPVAL